MRTQLDGQDTTRAKLDRQLYNTALLYGDNLRLVTDIEEEYGLLGYPPELVSVGLNAACEGKDPEKAVETYLVERMLQPDTKSSENLLDLLDLQ